MNRLTKRYKSGIVTLDADAFMETQETIDREIQNFYPAKNAIERLANQVKPVLIDCVENGKIEYYKEYLKEKCKLTITSSGMVMAG